MVKKEVFERIRMDRKLLSLERSCPSFLDNPREVMCIRLENILRHFFYQIVYVFFSVARDASGGVAFFHFALEAFARRM